MRADENKTVSVACKDARLLRMLVLEFERLGVQLSEYVGGGEAPSLLLVDMDDYPSLSSEVADDCVLIGWTRHNADEAKRNGEYAAILHRPFLTDELLLCAAELMRELGMLDRLLLERYERIRMGVLPAWGEDVYPRARAYPADVVLSDEPLCVAVGSEKIKLSPREWSIFKRLYDSRGCVVERGELARLIDAAEGTNTVEVHVCHLREKIEKPLGTRIFYTVRGVGYRME
ncbi:MAG: winged helix-turn-helix transcriptional regulator [Clostridia bacterium]|nr:winged helix-turn-helix transcriptional regulator [Clostridia bacterium]